MLRCAKKPHEGRAKDGETGMLLEVSGQLVGLERVAGSRAACTQSMAIAGVAPRHSVCQRTANRYHLAPRRRCKRRLPGLLLSSYPHRTQERIYRDTIAGVDFADIAPARAPAAGDRRLAYKAIWAESRRGGRFITIPRRGPARSAVLVRTYLGDDLAGTATSPLGCNRSAFASHALCPQNKPWQKIPKVRRWQRFATKLHLAARLVEWIVPILKKAGKNGVDRRRRRAIPSGPSCGAF